MLLAAIVAGCGGHSLPQATVTRCAARPTIGFPKAGIYRITVKFTYADGSTGSTGFTAVATPGVAGTPGTLTYTPPGPLPPNIRTPIRCAVQTTAYSSRL